MSETHYARDITKIALDEEADSLGVRRFTRRMLEKLADKRAEGYCGWNEPGECSVDRLKEMLSEHLPKGDMVDVANFAMMIWNRQNPTGETPSRPTPQQEET